MAAVGSGLSAYAMPGIISVIALFIFRRVCRRWHGTAAIHRGWIQTVAAVGSGHAVYAMPGIISIISPVTASKIEVHISH